MLKSSDHSFQSFLEALEEPWLALPKLIVCYVLLGVIGAGTIIGAHVALAYLHFDHLSSVTAAMHDSDHLDARDQ